jgi:hypothetical protein
MGEETAKSPFFVSDFVLKRNTLRQFNECSGGKEMSKVADHKFDLHQHSLDKAEGPSFLPSRT